MSVELVHRGERGRIDWTPELLAALRDELASGKTMVRIASEYGISECAARSHIGSALVAEARVHEHNAQDVMYAPAMPRHLGRPALPCGCRRGEPCERAQALIAAERACIAGSREWAIARQARLRHTSGEEQREGA